MNNKYERINVTKVEGVRNTHTLEGGDLYIMCNKKKEYKDYQKDLWCLSFFFKPVLGNTECIMTFLLFPEECEAMRTHMVKIAKDIGYLLSYDNGSIHFYNLGSFSNRQQVEGEHYCLDTYSVIEFKLDIPSSEWIDDESLISREYYDNGGKCGFPLAIADAINYVNEVEDEDLIARQLPHEDSMMITRFHYKK